jgi:hypothetical protein
MILIVIHNEYIMKKVLLKFNVLLKEKLELTICCFAGRTLTDKQMA